MGRVPLEASEMKINGEDETRGSKEAHGSAPVKRANEPLRSLNTSAQQKGQVSSRQSARSRSKAPEPAYRDQEAERQVRLRKDALRILPGSWQMKGEAFHADETELLKGVQEAILPRDFVEMIMVKEISGHILDAQRLRRLRDRMVDNALRRAATTLMAGCLVKPETSSISAEAAASKCVNDTANESEAKMFSLLAVYGIQKEQVLAEAFRSRFSEIERFDALIDQAYRRRDQLLRDIEVRRSPAKQSRRFPEGEIIDAEAEEVFPPKRIAKA